MAKKPTKKKPAKKKFNSDLMEAEMGSDELMEAEMGTGELMEMEMGSDEFNSADIGSDEFKKKGSDGPKYYNSFAESLDDIFAAETADLFNLDALI